MPILQKIDSVQLRVDVQPQVVHELIELYKGDAVLIPEFICENDGLDDFIGDVGEDQEPEAHAKKGVDQFNLVIGSDISVADVGDGVYTPVDTVEILDLPVIIEDGGVGGS